MKRLFILSLMIILTVGVPHAAMTGLEGHNVYIYPVVRVTTETNGGSGTVVYSRAKNGIFETYIITNNHVIADAVKIKDEWDSNEKKEVKIERRSVVFVEIFKYRSISDPTGTFKIQADILAYSKDQDLALLKLRYDEKINNVAKLPPKDLNYNVLDESISVGCSLLFPPIPAVGIISRKNVLVDSLAYDMSTSQIIYGNSGGAMFLSDGTWIGVPSMIPVTGWFLVVPITHMGLFIPFHRVYDWLDEEGYMFIYQKNMIKIDKEIKYGISRD